MSAPYRILVTGSRDWTDMDRVGRTGHEYCQTQAQRYDGTVKIAGQCKFCGAPCRCRCHGGRKRRP
ncbi:hypothetical protein [Streptomyces sp. NPDC059009]|uniref:hypothetical protein n=1 Tax=Streptomyces sp. NPDC059009 TaxID=3346694 RepID=UPI0036A0E3BB